MTAERIRHVPLRRCAACRASLPQAELIRFARDEQGRWRLDSERRAGGRGTWLCRRVECHSPKALGRAFRAQAPDVAEQLETWDTQNRGRPHERTPQDGGIDV